MKKSLFNNLLGRKQHETKLEASSGSDDTVINYMWMTKGENKKQEAVKKDPRIDTAILRNRIAEKISKMNNH